MNTRRIGLAVGVVTLLASGSYVFVYLYRWEWNRALVSGLIFLACEVALTTFLLNQRLRATEARLDTLVDVRHDRVLRRLEETAPAPRASFAWLARPEHTNVFVPVLLGAGVVLSALAWLVERVARVTARPTLERSLAGRLGELAPPAHGFLDPVVDPVALLRAPLPRDRA
ncbi:MAG: hypothetical protein GEV08_23930 [Acidimicrobiia bacterium]|nr:hypothetical protein [Acidimicrobiia bacterium]